MKDYLLNLRKLAVMAGMVASISTLSSCGFTDIKDDTNKISATMDEIKKEVARKTIDYFKIDEVIDALIYRATYSRISSANKFYNSRGNVYYGRSTEFENDENIEYESLSIEEEATRNIEDVEMDKGAILYRGLGR